MFQQMRLAQNIRLHRKLCGLTKELAAAVSDFFFRYDGAVRAGKHILWSDPLINLLFQDFDMDAGIRYLQDGLAVFEKIPGPQGYCLFQGCVYRLSA